MTPKPRYQVNISLDEKDYKRMMFLLDARLGIKKIDIFRRGLSSIEKELERD